MARGITERDQGREEEDTTRKARFYVGFGVDPDFVDPLTLWGGGIHHAEIETALPRSRSTCRRSVRWTRTVPSTIPGALDREAAEGRFRGPLHGLPVAIKDVMDVAGAPYTLQQPHAAGPRTRHRRRGDRHATAGRRARSCWARRTPRNTPSSIPRRPQPGRRRWLPSTGPPPTAARGGGDGRQLSATTNSAPCTGRWRRTPRGLFESVADAHAVLWPAGRTGHRTAGPRVDRRPALHRALDRARGAGGDGERGSRTGPDCPSARCSPARRGRTRTSRASRGVLRQRWRSESLQAAL